MVSSHAFLPFLWHEKTGQCLGWVVPLHIHDTPVIEFGLEGWSYSCFRLGVPDLGYPVRAMADITRARGGSKRGYKGTTGRTSLHN